MARNRRRADETLAAALAGGLTVRDAAERAGVSPRTAFRRLEEVGFRERVQKLRVDLLQQASGKLAQASGDAVDTLRNLLAADSDMVRLQASRALLEHVVRVRQAVEMEERLARLEAMVEGEART